MIESMSNRMQDRYKIIQTFSSGAFSTTYFAQDLQSPDELYCILKQFKPPVDHPELFSHAKELFEREAITLRQIGKHNQIPQILDYFETEHNIFLAREYIAGETLREARNRGEYWNEAEAIAFLFAMLPVLKLIHQHGIIHRDIKPENIIRRTSDQTLCLIDFGAVKYSVQISQAKTSPTIIHSFGYTPPEQLAGFSEESSDLYALGMTCIEMLIRASPASFIQATKGGKRIIQGLETLDMQDDFRALLERMVCLDPCQRHASAQQVIDALTRLDLTTLNVEAASSPLPVSYTPTVTIVSPQEQLGQQLEGSYTPTHWGLDSPNLPAPTAQELATASVLHPPSQTIKLERSTPLESNQLFLELSHCLTDQTLASQIKSIALHLPTKLPKFPSKWLIASVGLLIGSVFMLRFIYPTPDSYTSRSTTPITLEISRDEEQTLPKFTAIATAQDQSSMIKCISFSADSQTLLAVNEAGLIEHRSGQNLSTQMSLNTARKILSVDCANHPDTLALATDDGAIEIWDLAQRQRVQHILTDQLTWSLTYKGDRLLLATGGLNFISLWKLLPSTIKQIQQFEFSPQQVEPIQTIAISPDSSIVAAGNTAGQVKIVHRDTSQMQLLEGHTKAVNAVAIDVSGTLLLTGSDDDTIRIWNLYALQPHLRPLIQADVGGVTAIATSSNGQWMAAGGVFGKVNVWNWKTHQLVTTLTEHTAEITTLAFSSDGTRLAVGDRHGRITIYTSQVAPSID